MLRQNAIAFYPSLFSFLFLFLSLTLVRFVHVHICISLLFFTSSVHRLAFFVVCNLHFLLFFCVSLSLAFPYTLSLTFHFETFFSTLSQSCFFSLQKGVCRETFVVVRLASRRSFFLLSLHIERVEREGRVKVSESEQDTCLFFFFLFFPTPQTTILGIENGQKPFWRRNRLRGKTVK